MNQYIIKAKLFILLLIAFILAQCKNENEHETMELLSRIELKLGINSQGESINERTLAIERYLSNLEVSSMVIGSGCRDTVEGEYYSFLVFTRVYSPDLEEDIQVDLPSDAEIVQMQFDPRSGHFVKIKNFAKGMNEFRGYIVNKSTLDTILFKKTFYAK